MQEQTKTVHEWCGMLAVVFAILSSVLTGCAATPQVVTRVVTPPESLLRDCPHAPRPTGNTVEALAMGLIAERGVVESCDWADKAALRAWSAGVQAGLEASK